MTKTYILNQEQLSAIDIALKNNHLEDFKQLCAKNKEIFNSWTYKSSNDPMSKLEDFKNNPEHQLGQDNLTSVPMILHILADANYDNYELKEYYIKNLDKQQLEWKNALGENILRIVFNNFCYGNMGHVDINIINRLIEASPNQLNEKDNNNISTLHALQKGCPQTPFNPLYEGMSYTMMKVYDQLDEDNSALARHMFFTHWPNEKAMGDLQLFKCDSKAEFYKCYYGHNLIKYHRDLREDREKYRLEEEEKKEQALIEKAITHLFNKYPAIAELAKQSSEINSHNDDKSELIAQDSGLITDEHQ